MSRPGRRARARLWLMVAGAALGAEALGLRAALAGNLGGFGGWHLLATGFAGVATSGLAPAPRGGWRDRSLAIGAVTLLAAGLPGVGACGLVFVLIPSWTRRPRREAAAPRELERSRLDAASLSPAGSLEAFADPSLAEVLTSEPRPNQRLAAVAALRQLEARRAVPLLRLALADRHEEVRLCAHAILEQRERGLRHRIERDMQALAGAGLQASPARWALFVRLASSHWELVYAGYVQAGAADVALERAAGYARRALEIRHEPESALLLARILLRQGREAEACGWLRVAEDAGAAGSACRPLHAEAAFIGRRFQQLRRMLTAWPSAEPPRPVLRRVVEFWRASREDVRP